VAGTGEHPAGAEGILQERERIIRRAGIRCENRIGRAGLGGNGRKDGGKVVTAVAGNEDGGDPYCFRN
jgi:hypothetical protein